MMTASSQALPASTLNRTLNQQTAPISYQFDFTRFLEHLVDVSLTFTADTDAPSLWLPAWIPGSYLMREFARNITAVHYEILDSQTLNNQTLDGQLTDSDKKTNTYRAQKIDKNTWQLPQVRAGQSIHVHYEVYCYDLSVRTAYVDQQRLYGNFTSLALAIEGQEQKAVEVDLIVPAVFLADKDASRVRLACGLEAVQSQGDKQQIYTLQADSYHELIDYPFEIAEQDSFDFIIQDDKHQTIGHHFYLAGKHSANMGR